MRKEWLEVQSWTRVGVRMLRLKKFVLSSSFKNSPSKPCSGLFRSREQKSMLEAKSSAWPISSSLQAYSVLFDVN